MCDGNWSVNGVAYPCAECQLNIETDGTCHCRSWEKWFKAYWKELRKRFKHGIK